jgi:hypothetical protein
MIVGRQLRLYRAAMVAAVIIILAQYLGAVVFGAQFAASDPPAAVVEIPGREAG